MTTPVITLRNIGPKVAAALHEVGIDSVEALRDVGPVEAFRRMQAAAQDDLPVRHFLYALEAGLLRITTADLPMRRRVELFRAARGWSLEHPAAEARPKRTVWARRRRRR